jgi:TonB family protein
MKNRRKFGSHRTSFCAGLLGALVLLLGNTPQAQETRKIKISVQPEYPELAKRMHLTGVARVQITITREGTIREVKDLGGNPVLVDALTRAVQKWKYEPAAKESTVEVKFDFTPT